MNRPEGRKRSTFAALVVGFLVLAIVIALLWALISFAGLQTSLLWAAIMGALAWVVRSSVEQRREYQRLLAESKRTHYEEFLKFISQVMPVPGAAVSDAISGQRADSLSLTELRDWSIRLTFIGSDDVVKAWNQACAQRGNGEKGDQNACETLRVWGKLWIAMRKDCGHPDTALKPSDVLATFVNDIGENKEKVDRA